MNPMNGDGLRRPSAMKDPFDPQDLLSSTRAQKLQPHL
jgi:hypothetical protein